MDANEGSGLADSKDLPSEQNGRLPAEKTLPNEGIEIAEDKEKSNAESGIAKGKNLSNKIDNLFQSHFRTKEYELDAAAGSKVDDKGIKKQCSVCKRYILREAFLCGANHILCIMCFQRSSGDLQLQSPTPNLWKCILKSGSGICDELVSEAAPGYFKEEDQLKDDSSSSSSSSDDGDQVETKPVPPASAPASSGNESTVECQVSQCKGPDVIPSQKYANHLQGLHLVPLYKSEHCRVKVNLPPRNKPLPNIWVCAILEAFGKIFTITIEESFNSFYFYACLVGGDTELYRCRLELSALEAAALANRTDHTVFAWMGKVLPIARGSVDDETAWIKLYKDYLFNHFLIEETYFYLHIWIVRHDKDEESSGTRKFAGSRFPVGVSIFRPSREEKNQSQEIKSDEVVETETDPVVPSPIVEIELCNNDPNRMNSGASSSASSLMVVGIPPTQELVADEEDNLSPGSMMMIPSPGIAADLSSMNETYRESMIASPVLVANPVLQLPCSGRNLSRMDDDEDWEPAVPEPRSTLPIRPSRPARDTNIRRGPNSRVVNVNREDPLANINFAGIQVPLDVTLRYLTRPAFLVPWDEEFIPRYNPTQRQPHQQPHVSQPRPQQQPPVSQPRPQQQPPVSQQQPFVSQPRPQQQSPVSQPRPQQQPPVSQPRPQQQPFVSQSRPRPQQQPPVSQPRPQQQPFVSQPRPRPQQQPPVSQPQRQQQPPLSQPRPQQQPFVSQPRPQQQPHVSRPQRHESTSTRPDNRNKSSYRYSHPGGNTVRVNMRLSSTSTVRNSNNTTQSQSQQRIPAPAPRPRNQWRLVAPVYQGPPASVQNNPDQSTIQASQGPWRLLAPYAPHTTDQSVRNPTGPQGPSWHWTVPRAQNEQQIPIRAPGSIQASQGPWRLLAPYAPHTTDQSVRNPTGPQGPWHWTVPRAQNEQQIPIRAPGSLNPARARGRNPNILRSPPPKKF